MTSRHKASLGMLVLILLACAAPAQLAAQVPERSGFFIGFGLGYGSLGVEDLSDRETGLSGYLKLGGTLNSKVLLGVETGGWTKEENGATLTYGSLNGVAYIYPSETSGFYLKGGAGLATVELDLGIAGSADSSGLGVTLGAGYDIGFGGRFGLTPYLNYLWGSFDGGNANVVQLGLGVNWY